MPQGGRSSADSRWTSSRRSGPRSPGGWRRSATSSSRWSTTTWTSGAASSSGACRPISPTATWPPATAGVTAAPRASEPADEAGPRPTPTGGKATRPVLASRRRCAGILGAGALLAALAATGCARGGPPVAAATAPPLWRMQAREGAPGSGWLFGSVHAGLDPAEKLPPVVERAWASADVLAIEIDVTARWASLRELYAASALLPGDGTIEALLGLLAGQDPSRGGRAPGAGLEARFLESARQRAMPVVELEQPAEQVDALAGIGLRAQADWLWRRFESIRHGDGLAEAIVAA